MIPILGLVLPVLVQLAEHLFPKGSDGEPTGSAKRTWVMDMLREIYEAEKAHLPAFVSAEMFLKFGDFLVEKILDRLRV